MASHRSTSGHQPTENRTTTKHWKMDWLRLIRQTFAGVSQDNVPRLGAALAFYAAFSTTPLLLLAIAISGLFFGEEAIEGQLKHELVVFVGQDAADGIQSMIAASSSQKDASVVSSLVGVVILLFGATGVFVELKSSMNTIWQIEQLPNTTFVAFVMDRLFSIVMVIGIAVLLVLSLLLTTAVSMMSRHGYFSSAWIQMADQFISFLLVVLLFSLIFKYLPDAIVQWEDVWVGAFVTAILFTIGKWCVASYFVTFATSTSYGAVGSMAVFLLWAYYLSQILFFGAEMTQVYAEMTGKKIVPKRNARLKTC